MTTMPLLHLPTVNPLDMDKVVTRNDASSGLWLVILLPLSLSPGLYSTYADCIPSPKILALLACQVGVSGVYLYRQICASKKMETGAVVTTSSRFIRLLKHPCLPAIVTTGAMVVLIDMSPCVAAPLASISLWVMYRATNWLLTSFPGSFTLGEGAVLGQSAALTITYSVYTVSGALLFNVPMAEVQEICLFTQIAVLIVAMFVGGMYKSSVLRQPKMVLPYLCLCGVIGVAVSSLLIGEPSHLWLVDVVGMKEARLYLLAWWGSLSFLSMAITTIARRMKVPTTVLRKVYHVVICLVFTPGILVDPAFTQLAASGALMLCGILEFVRILKIEPIASVITNAFAVFLDEKDGGLLILSHIYLLAGVSSPLWLSPCPLPSSQSLPAPANSLLPLLAGVLAVGVGDTAASIGGTYLGKRKWQGTKKTVEGSICYVAAQLGVVGLLVLGGAVEMSLPAWARLTISAVVGAAVEALTDQVDNIVLPLILYTPLMDL